MDKIPREILRLIEAAVDRPLSDEELLQLEAAAIHNPEVMRFYDQYMQMVADLMLLARQQESWASCEALLDSLNDESKALPTRDESDTEFDDGSTPEEKAPADQPAVVLGFLGDTIGIMTQTTTWLILLVGAIGGLLLGRAMMDPQRMQLTDSDPPTQRTLEEGSYRIPILAARLTDTLGCEWAKGSASHSEGDFISEGTVLRLKEGRVRLDFNCGIQMVLLGGSVVRVDSDKGVYLERGVLTALASTEQGIGFVVETPACKIIDLGTEFGVTVDEPDGTGWISVFDGEVEVESAGNVQQFVTADIVRVSKSLDSEPLVLRHSNKGDNPYRRFVRLSDFHPPTFSKVTTNTRRPYLIMPGGLCEDALMYLDRRYEWNGIDETGMPSFLLGADYVMPLNDDKSNTELEVRVTLSIPSTLYVMFDDRITPLPQWLTSQFYNTGQKIGADEIYPTRTIVQGAGKSVDRVFSIWERHVDAKELTVVLGGIEQTGDKTSMFGIAAIPCLNYTAPLAKNETTDSEDGK